jgi:hypothetical protein
VVGELPRRTLRALLSGDMAEFGVLSEQLEGAANTATNHLVGAVFYVAARRRWVAGEVPVGVADFAVELRDELEVEPGQIDPAEVAALVVAAVTGETAGMARIAPDVLISLETLAAYKLVTEFRLGGDELEELLSEAERLAAGWAE